MSNINFFLGLYLLFFAIFMIIASEDTFQILNVISATNMIIGIVVFYMGRFSDLGGENE